MDENVIWLYKAGLFLFGFFMVALIASLHLAKRQEDAVRERYLRWLEEVRRARSGE